MGWMGREDLAVTVRVYLDNSQTAPFWQLRNAEKTTKLETRARYRPVPGAVAFDWISERARLREIRGKGKTKKTRMSNEGVERRKKCKGVTKRWRRNRAGDEVNEIESASTNASTRSRLHERTKGHGAGVSQWGNTHVRSPIDSAGRSFDIALFPTTILGRV